MAGVGVKMAVARRWVALVRPAGWVWASPAVRGAVRLGGITIAHWSCVVLRTAGLEANADRGPHHLRSTASPFPRVVRASATSMSKMRGLRRASPLLRGMAAGMRLRAVLMAVRCLLLDGLLVRRLLTVWLLLIDLWRVVWVIVLRR